MQRIHVHVSVAELDRSLAFYRSLFGREPDIRKPDYARWMLDDPRVNFAIKVSERERGVGHVGIQAESLEELGDVRARLAAAEAEQLHQDDTRCCYSRSTKTWVRDPDGVSWETFVTFETGADAGSAGCCAAGDPAAAGCCA